MTWHSIRSCDHCGSSQRSDQKATLVFFEVSLHVDRVYQSGDPPVDVPRVDPHAKTMLCHLCLKAALEVQPPPPLPPRILLRLAHMIRGKP